MILQGLCFYVLTSSIFIYKFMYFLGSLSLHLVLWLRWRTAMCTFHFAATYDELLIRVASENSGVPGTQKNTNPILYSRAIGKNAAKSTT